MKQQKWSHNRIQNLTLKCHLCEVNIPRYKRVCPLHWNTILIDSLFVCFPQLSFVPLTHSCLIFACMIACVIKRQLLRWGHYCSSLNSDIIRDYSTTHKMSGCWQHWEDGLNFALFMHNISQLRTHLVHFSANPIALSWTWLSIVVESWEITNTVNMQRRLSKSIG